MNFKNNLARSRFSFPVTLTTDEVDGGFTVTFRDLPEAITQGENIEDALNEAADCLEEAIAARLDDNREIPTPTAPTPDEFLIHTFLQMAFKAAVYLAMQAKINQVQLANLLKVDKQEIQGLFTPNNSLKITILEKALSCFAYMKRLR